MRLTKEHLFGLSLKTRTVDIPELGGSVEVREMPGGEVERMGQELQARGADGDGRISRAMVIARTVYDEDGNRLFDDGDVEAIDKMPNAIVQRLYDVAESLCGLSEQAVSDMEGNLSAGHDASSPSS